MKYNIVNYNIINVLKKRMKKGFKSTGGRNFLGRVCVQGRGLCKSSKKTLYRFLDFYRRINKVGMILNVYYDTNRTGKIGLILYENGLSSFILLQKGVMISSLINTGLPILPLKLGDSTVLNNIPLFSIISNIENKPFKGGNLCRAAGVSALLVSKNDKFAFLKLNSGWQLKLSLNCISSIGAISNKWNKNIIGKAGKNRGLGKKSKVRGVAKNPCDHPHGGGNGKRSKPTQPVNAWKTVFKWTPTNIKQYQLLKKKLYKNIN